MNDSNNTLLITFYDGIEYVLLAFWYIYVPYILIYIIFSIMSVVGKLKRSPYLNFECLINLKKRRDTCNMFHSYKKSLRSNSAFIIMTNLLIFELLMGLTGMPVCLPVS